jgi:hypothetical protein
LGIVLKSNCSICEIDENWEAKFSKCENIIRSWMGRDLTMIGRITLVKSFLAPQFLYLMQSVFLPQQIIDRINTLFFKYIWSKGHMYKESDLRTVKERVKRKTLVKSYQDQGLNMIDMNHFQIAFACKWISNLESDNSASWKRIPLYHYSQILPGLNIFKCNVPFKEVRGIPKYFPNFYKKILVIWLDNNCYLDRLQNTITSAQLLWNNKLIAYRNNPLYVKRWINAGILFVSDFLDERGNIDYNILYQKIRNGPITVM